MKVIKWLVKVLIGKMSVDEMKFFWLTISVFHSFWDRAREKRREIGALNKTLDSTSLLPLLILFHLPYFVT